MKTGASTATRFLAGLGLAASTGACAPVEATYPHCPVPVLISRVNRVGSKTPAPGIETGTLDVTRAKTQHYSAASSDGQTSRSETNTAGPMILTFEVLQLVPNEADARASEIQLDGISTGNFLFFGLFASVHEMWTAPTGRKVWVK